ncbi:zinc-binding dehydrogenase [Gottschalkiaceae bacterium SANA]|nr:zinc-binding dehydrogenase [Gottschalkiaceae bacterium SANA]
MKAVMKQEEGYDKMDLVEVLEPKVRKDWVKIQVAYCGICGTDLLAFKGQYPSSLSPLILGHEFSGVIVEMGPEVKWLKKGMRVVSETTFETCGVCIHCREAEYNLCSNRIGIGTQKDGGMAEYVLAPQSSVHVLPDNVKLRTAALMEPLACGIHAGIEKGKIAKGEVVCVFGAGAIGLLLSSVAKACGAYVISAGIASDSERLALARRMGVDRTVDQSVESIEEVIAELTKGLGADKVFECSGAVQALNVGLKIVRKKGKVIQMGVFPHRHESIATELILQKEIEYLGSRSQKPSSWEKAIQLLREECLNGLDELSSFVLPLEEWRTGFEIMMDGSAIKVLLKCENPEGE